MPVRSPLVDAYLARLPVAPRQALAKIRAAVHAAAPGCEECLFYGMPAVRLDGEPLVGWRAAAKHGAFHPLSGSTVAACAEALAEYDTSKGTVRFAFDAPLPPSLVKRLVAARIAEIKALATNKQRPAAEPGGLMPSAKKVPRRTSDRPCREPDIVTRRRRR